MIKKAKIEKGSIKKAQEKVEREEVLSPSKELIPLLGRVGAFHCEQCGDISTHRIGSGFTECIRCGIKTLHRVESRANNRGESLQGEFKVKQLEEIIII